MLGSLRICLSIDLKGFYDEVLSNSRLRFCMIYNRPLVDQGGNFLDATKARTKSTIRVFERKRGRIKLEFIKAMWSEAFPAPNNVAATGNGSVFVTNDDGETAGW
jgi:hypothetical protein